MATTIDSANVHDAAAIQQQTAYLLALAHERARRAFNQALRPLGIQAKHLGVLMALSSDRSFSQKRLGDHLELDKSSVVIIVDDLERLKLAQRHQDQKDRRAHVLEITEQGRQLVTAAAKIARELERKIFAGLSQDDRKQLDRALSRVIHNCAKATKPSTTSAK